MLPTCTLDLVGMKVCTGVLSPIVTAYLWVHFAFATAAS